MSVRRLLLGFASAALAFLGVELVSGELVTSAIAHAPNSARALSVRGSVPPRAPPGARQLVIAVGPPAAALDAWVLEPSDRCRGTLVLLHGVRSDKSSLLELGRRFTRAGYRSVLVDLRGQGASTGTYLTYGVVESRDVVQVIDALEARYSGTPFAVFGYSYGAAVAIQGAARDRRLQAVVAVSGFASLRQVVSDYKRNFFPWLDPVLPETWLQTRLDAAGERARFDPDQAAPAHSVAALKVPLLLIHGAADTQIPPVHARALKENSERATLVLLDGENHASMLGSGAAQVEELTLAFLERSGFH